MTEMLSSTPGRRALVRPQDSNTSCLTPSLLEEADVMMRDDAADWKDDSLEWTATRWQERAGSRARTGFDENPWMRSQGFFPCCRGRMYFMSDFLLICQMKELRLFVLSANAVRSSRSVEDVSGRFQRFHFLRFHLAALSIGTHPLPAFSFFFF